jgi:hypothetical protein
MLIAALTTLFLLVFTGGSGGDRDILATITRIEPAVQACVKDSARAGRGARIAREMRSELKAFMDQVKKDREAFLEVDARHETTEDDLWKVFRASTTTWETYEHRLIELRFTLKETLTREEWKALFEALEDTVPD